MLHFAVMKSGTIINKFKFSLQLLDSKLWMVVQLSLMMNLNTWFFCLFCTLFGFQMFKEFFLRKILMQRFIYFHSKRYQKWLWDALHENQKWRFIKIHQDLILSRLLSYLKICVTDWLDLNIFHISIFHFQLLMRQ